MPTPVISATRLKTVAACERKYAGDYLFGLREPQGAGALFGEQFHNAAEIYQLTGRVPSPESPVGRLLRAGTHFLRRPGSGALIEAEHRGELPDGTEWVAYVDASDTPATSKFDQLRLDDQKTTSDAGRALTDKTLTDDLQAGFYSWIAHTPHIYRLDEDSPWLEWDPSGFRSVALSWNYFLTRGSPRAWQVHGFVKRDDAARFLDTRVMPLVERIRALHSAFDAGTLKELNHADRDLNGCGGVGTWCGAFTKCDFNTGGLVALRSNKETHMGLQELRAKYGQKKPDVEQTTPPPTQETVEEATAPETRQETTEEVSKLTGKPRARRVAPPAEPPAPEGDRINPPEAVQALAEIREEVANDVVTEKTLPRGSFLDLVERLQAALPPGVTITLTGKAA